MSPGLIAVFRSAPKELFRVNNGLRVNLRGWSRGRRVFDLITRGGRVEPKALCPATYRAPNGASMRPNSPYQQLLVSRLFKGRDVVVYAVPAGTPFPEDLILVHERSDHYSLQPAKEMTLDELNSKITSFLRDSASLYTRDQWLNAYRAATELHLSGTRTNRI